MNKKALPHPEDIVTVNKISFTHQDIFNVIDDFYSSVQHDVALSIPFQSVHDWPEHVERLTHFWWIRFGGKSYMINDYNPVLKHFFAGFNDDLLKRWLELFQTTLSKHLNEEQVQTWSTVAHRIGDALTLKNEMYKKHYEEQNKKS